MGSAVFLSGDTAAGFSTASTTQYGGILGSALGPQSNASTTEADVQAAMAAGGTLSNFFTNVLANARSTDVVIKIRLNGADTALAITYATGQTGVKSDTSNNVTVAQDDLVCNAQTNSTGGGGFTIKGCGVRFDATSGTVASMFSQGAVTYSGTGPITDYANLAGQHGPATLVEADVQASVPMAGTSRYLQTYVTTNARSTDTVITSRVNAGAGSQTITYTSGQTGLKKDTTHTDTVAAGDKLNAQVALGTGTGNFIMRTLGIHITATTAGQSFAALQRATTSIAAASTLYCQIAGRPNTSATETDRQAAFGTDCTASKLLAIVAVNASTTDISLRFRNGAASGNQVVTITALTTGTFQDTTHSDTIVAADLINYQFSGGTTGAMTFSSVSMLLAVASGVVFIAPPGLNIRQAVHRASYF